METEITLIIYTVLMIFPIIIFASYIFKTVKSAIMLRRARKNGENIIQCRNSFYNMMFCIIRIIWNMFLAYLLFRCLFEVLDIELSFQGSFIIPTILLIFNCICAILNVIMNIMAIFREKNIYLISGGIVIFSEFFDFKSCRFAWETSNNPNKSSKTLHIYKPKQKSHIQ